MKKFVNIYKYILISIVVIIVCSCVAYNYGIGAVNKESKEISFTVDENSTYLSIANQLKENNLIRSVNFYKVYIKIFKPNNLQKGTYMLNQNMGVKKIIEILENNVIDKISFVIPEGKRIGDIADYISKVTNLSSEELINYWESEELINNLINKYWFITSDVKNSKLRHKLEGYFFPATYDFSDKNITKEQITFMMLDKTNEILSKYKDEIENSSFSVHEILTLSSIVEYESALDIDRPEIAGVFLNRLDKQMKLQSCATLGYALNEWKLTYTVKDQEVDSPYNTYKYLGLPIGPGNSPGEASIKAVLFPSDNDYLYFLANVYSSDKKTYYSKTYSEHQQKCKEYLGYTC